MEEVIAGVINTWGLVHSILLVVIVFELLFICIAGVKIALSLGEKEG